MAASTDDCPPDRDEEHCQDCRARDLEELAALRERVRTLEARLGLSSQVGPLHAPDDVDLATWGLVAEHAHDFVSLHASDGRYVFVSPAVQGVLGWCTEDLLGQDAYRYFHPQDRALVAATHARQEGGLPLRVEYRLLHKKGHWVWVETTSRAVVEDGKVQHIICITRDIGERRRADERLRESNRRLQQFATVAAHDLKAPLQSISAFAEIVLAGEAARSLPPNERRMLERVVAHSQRMGQLVDDLLVWCRMESEEQPVVPTDLNAVAARVLEGLDLAIRERHARVEVDELPVVSGNPNLFQVMLQNLVANAIKFTPADRVPCIQIRASRVGQGWDLSVSDNGRGITEDQRRGIFDMFCRAEGSEDVPGQGIGLALCARIAALHGGGIQVRSEPGQGSVFTVSLPDEDLPTR